MCALCVQSVCTLWGILEQGFIFPIKAQGVNIRPSQLWGNYFPHNMQISPQTLSIRRIFPITPLWWTHTHTHTRTHTYWCQGGYGENLLWGKSVCRAEAYGEGGNGETLHTHSFPRNTHTAMSFSFPITIFPQKYTHCKEFHFPHNSIYGDFLINRTHILSPEIYTLQWVSISP